MIAKALNRHAAAQVKTMTFHSANEVFRLYVELLLFNAKIELLHRQFISDFFILTPRPIGMDI